MIDLLAEIVLGVLVGACALLGAWVLFFAWRRRRLRGRPTPTVLDQEGMLEKLGAIHDAQAKFQELMRQRSELWNVPSVAALFTTGQVADGDFAEDDTPTMTLEEGHADLLARASKSSKVFDILMVMAVDVEDYELAAKLRDMGRPS